MEAGKEEVRLIQGVRERMRGTEYNNQITQGYE